MWKKFNQCLVLIASLAMSSVVLADGVTIDKVYDPYVYLLEKEVEVRTLYQNDSDGDVNGGLRYSLAYGQSLTDQFFAEIYLIVEDKHGESLEIEGYEAEFKWQLTEQGEYDNDWGLLFEFEKNRELDIWEASTTLIALHEWPDWILTGNLAVTYEWGNDIHDEWEADFSSQLRYRYKEILEPAIEFYQAEETQGVGPVLTGLYRMGKGRGIKWEFGVIFGTDSKTADTNWKLNLEYEF